MDLEIIRKYKINFQTKLLDGIIDNADPVSITGILLRADAEDLLSIINDVINDVVNEIEFSTEICEVSIYKDISIFYHNGSAHSSIPTTDLKQIVEGWINFLETSPFDVTEL